MFHCCSRITIHLWKLLNFSKDYNAKTREALFYFPFGKLTLSLLVLRILTDYSDSSLSLNNLAFFANRLYRWSNLHSNSPFPKKYALHYIRHFVKWQALLLKKFCYYYLSLQMILPLVKSYGESSIVTLSPGKIRM